MPPTVAPTNAESPSIDNSPYIGRGGKMGHSGGTYAGGDPGGLARYYSEQMRSPKYGVEHDPYFTGWADETQGNQLADRQRLQQMYGTLQRQAAGGMTPQQAQHTAGMVQAAQAQQNVASSAAGGARARSAAMGNISQQAGIQGAQGIQQGNQIRAADQMNAVKQMQQISSMQRAADLQAQGLTAEDAQRQAQLEVNARGLNIQRELGYAGLQGQAIQGDYQSYLDALRQNEERRKQGKEEEMRNIGAGVQAGSTIVAGGAAFV